MPRCTLTPQGDGLALASPYDPAFVAAFKALVPAQVRRWDAASKRWIIGAAQAKSVADLCETFFMERPHVPAVQTAPAAPQIRVFRIEYLGACKPRDGGGVSAMGYCDGAWSVIAPEAVLRAWFEGAPKADAAPAQPAAPATYYALLGVGQDADDAALKSGYRRMARQWHPDVNKEECAHERFLAIRDAYNVLSDPVLRKKYNVGLLFQERSETRHESRSSFSLNALAAATSYRAPLTCGMVLAEATPAIGRWSFSKILAWDDITRPDGMVMVSSWPKDGEHFEVRWVLQ